jgi:outer membrane protein assembly factor BamE (lipoprotein component of BamABCDE complex)
MKNQLFRIFPLLAVLALTSCVTTYEDFTANQAQVKKGMTKEQVRALMGRPNGEMTMNDKETWVYSRHQSSGIAVIGLYGIEQKGINITFGPEGRVTDINRSGFKMEPAIKLGGS